ncbi:MAG: protein NO VEIN domain-containing protein [Limisphaerales bacterium]
MLEHGPNSLEKVGMGHVTSVETFKGCRIELVRRTSGFNGLSTNKDGEVRKIEVKTMQTQFKWIAISNLTAIDKLFLERDYWIYFVLVPQNYVVMTKALPFIKKQLSFTAHDGFLSELDNWIKCTRRLTKNSGLKFLPKIQLKFPIALDEIVKQLVRNPLDKAWHDSVIEIWQNKSSWERLYLAPEKE